MADVILISCTVMIPFLLLGAIYYATTKRWFDLLVCACFSYCVAMTDSGNRIALADWVQEIYLATQKLTLTQVFFLSMLLALIWGLLAFINAKQIRNQK